MLRAVPDDEFVTLELHHEEGEEQAHQNSNQNGCHQAQPSGASQPAHRHGGEGTHEDHAVHPDVHDTGVLSHQSAHGRQPHGSGAAEHLPE